VRLVRPVSRRWLRAEDRELVLLSFFLALSTSVAHAMAPWIYVMVFWFLSASLCHDVTLYLQPGYRFWVSENSAVMSCFPCHSHSAALGCYDTALLASSAALFKLATAPVFCLPLSWASCCVLIQPMSCMSTFPARFEIGAFHARPLRRPSRIRHRPTSPFPEAALKEPRHATMVSRTCQHPKGCNRFQHRLPRAIPQFTLAQHR